MRAAMTSLAKPTFAESGASEFPVNSAAASWERGRKGMVYRKAPNSWSLAMSKDVW